MSAAIAPGARYRVAPAAVDGFDNDRAVAAPVTVVWSTDMTVTDFGRGDVGANRANQFSNVTGDLLDHHLLPTKPRAAYAVTGTYNRPEVATAERTCQRPCNIFSALPVPEIKFWPV